MDFQIFIKSNASFEQCTCNIYSLRLNRL